MPGPDNIPGIPGVGSLKSAPLFPGGPSIPGLGTIENGVSNFFDNPGGHTDSNYDMFVAENGSPASNLMNNGYTGPDQNPGIMTGLDANKRQPTPAPYTPPPLQFTQPMTPRQQGPIVHDPHGNLMGTFAGGWGNGAGSRQWEVSGNGGNRWTTQSTSPTLGSGPGQGWTQTGTNSYVKRY
jgi:hypothetical protein